MPRTFVSYELGRLNILPHVDNAAKRDFLMSGLAAGAAEEFHGNLWSFLDVTVVEDVEGSTYILGYLVKYEREAREEVVDETRHRIATETIENAIRAKSHFALHLPSLIMAFHLVVPEISRGVFVERFARLFQAGHGNFFVQADIQLILDERLILEALRSFEAITRVSISLHPSNPSNRERWRLFDEHLKSVNAAKFKEEYIAAPLKPGDPGILAAGDPDIESKIVMAEDGYGEARVTGIKDGKLRTITTKRNPVTTMAPRDEAASPRTIAETLHEAVKKVLERFR